MNTAFSRPWFLAAALAAAGGATDVLARIIGAKLAEGLGQQVVIDNRAGASGAPRCWFNPFAGCLRP
jgi:tripartite-type tricarboxylate transporter receptor subunit TctC